METVFSVACVSFGLTINVRLYWTEHCVEGSTDSVHSLDLLTLQEATIVENNITDFYWDVAVYEETVYWTGLGRVYSAPVAGGGNTTELLYVPSYGGNSSRGIKVVHPDLQPDPRNTISPHISSSSSPLTTATEGDYFTSSPLTSSHITFTPLTESSSTKYNITISSPIQPSSSPTTDTRDTQTSVSSFFSPCSTT